MGRWAPKSNAFLEYIQNQLLVFLVGTTTNMRQIAWFSNIEGASTNKDYRPPTIF